MSAHALGALSKVTKPSQAAARVLSKLFTTSRAKRPAASDDAFDPTEACVASASKKKKKGFRCKASNIVVAVLSRYSSNVPRGKKRELLKKENR